MVRCKNRSCKRNLQLGEWSSYCNHWRTLQPPKPGTSFCQHCHFNYEEEGTRRAYTFSTALYGAPVCDETAVNLAHSEALSHPSIKSSSEVPNIPLNMTRDWLHWRVDSNSPWWRLPSSGHWLKWSKLPRCLATVGSLEKRFEAETIYIDETFKGSPWLFYQLFTVHAMYNSQHFPLSMLCCWTKQRTTPSAILSDFEGGIICSITLQFPGAHHQGCFYHFSQPIYHKPWATSRVHQQQWTSVLHPPTDGSSILTRVGDLHPLYWTEATEAQYTSSVDSLLSCFENTWLDGEQFSPTLWSVFEQDWNRTNNHLEGWHRKFNA